MNSPISAKSTMACSFSFISFSVNPSSIPDKYIFSLPVSESLKPTPNDNKETEFPFRLIVPSFGLNTPAIALSSVDLPLPFLPMIPIISPFSAVNVIPLTASNTCAFSASLFMRFLCIENFCIIL